MLLERYSGKDSHKHSQHLKIREWPPSGDLAEVYPDRYSDFTAHLPIPDYTHREGQLNLASRLPSFFVRPDLGPRLHIAHDLTHQPKVCIDPVKHTFVRQFISRMGVPLHWR